MISSPSYFGGIDCVVIFACLQIYPSMQHSRYSQPYVNPLLSNPASVLPQAKVSTIPESPHPSIFFNVRLSYTSIKSCGIILLLQFVCVCVGLSVNMLPDKPLNRV